MTNKIKLWENNSLNDDLYTVSFSETSDYSFEKVSMFTIEITQQCNLRCKYCIYSGSYENRRTHNDSIFPSEAIPSLVEFINKHADINAPQITVCFYGGEALLRKDNIKRIISELSTLALHFEYTISTNGILLTNENIEWILSIPYLKLTVTVDGDEVTHDANRIFPNGMGSYNIVMNNLQRFQSIHPEEYNRRIQFLATVDSITRIPALSKYWINNPILSNNRPVHISSILPNFTNNYKLNPTVLLQNQLQVYNQALNDYLYGKENILTDELRRLVSIIEHRQFFDLPKQQRFITCCHNPYSCFISSTGQLYICEKFDKNHSVGNIKNGYNIESLQKINKIFTRRKNSHCSICWAKRLCRICATNVNHSIKVFELLCVLERQKIQLALKYYCELKEAESTQLIKKYP